MIEISYEPTVPSDVDELMADLRDCDREEMLVGTGQDPRDVIEQSIENSNETRTLRLDGKLIAVIGLGYAGIVDGYEAGCPWLIGTNAVNEYRIAFHRITKEINERFKREYELLVNFVHVENKVSIEWLETLGYEMLEATEWGPNKAMFHPFYILQEAD